MNIYIQPGDGTTRVDVTPYIEDKESALSTLTQSREYRRFKRESSDVRVVLSNWDGVIEALLANVTTAARYRLTVEDGGETLFDGEIAPERVSHDAHQEWFTVTAYDPMAQLGVILARTRCRPLYGISGMWTYPPVLMTLTDFFDYELFRRHHLNDTGLIKAIDLGDFAAKGIRYAGFSTELGNAGRFEDIDPALTWDKMLEGIGIWWNADFWIEPETRTLKMTRRRSLTGQTRNITQAVYDRTVTISVLDEEPVDWIRVVLPYKLPKEVSLTLGAANKYDNAYLRGYYSFNNDTVEYVCVYYKNDQPLYVGRSVSIQVPLEDSRVGYFIDIDVPPGGDACTRRELYRWVSSLADYTTARWGPFYKTELNNNSAVHITDMIGPIQQRNMTNLTPMPQVGLAPQTAICRINKTTGLWEGPYYDGDFQALNAYGNILDCYPEFRFTNRSNNELQEFSAYALASFFLKERTYEQVQEQYADLFRAPLGVKLTAEGTLYNIGDEVIIDNVPRLYGRRNVIVKAAKVNLQAERTELECFL